MPPRPPRSRVKGPKAGTGLRLSQWGGHWSGDGPMAMPRERGLANGVEGNGELLERIPQGKWA